jgi:hypothetical protein
MKVIPETRRAALDIYVNKKTTIRNKRSLKIPNDIF